METLGARIRWARERAGLTQSELAEKVGVAAGSRVSEWENDRRQPSAPVLMALPGELGISGHWLLTGEGERIRESKALTSDTVVRAIRRMMSGEVPGEIVRMLASPSASTYLTGDRVPEAPALPEPAVPSAIMRRRWLLARIRHHEAPYYLDFSEGEDSPQAASSGVEAAGVPERPEGPEPAGPGEEASPGRSSVDERSIYEEGYVWGHLAH